MLSTEDKRWIRDEIDNAINPLKEDVSEMNNNLIRNNLLIENTIQPLLSELTSCYTAAEKKFSRKADEIDDLKLKADICYDAMERHEVKIKALEAVCYGKQAKAK